MGGALAALMVLGLALLAGPIVAGATGNELGGFTTTIMMGSGGLILLVAGILVVVTKLYVKTKADEAFVKTGMGGLRVIQDGGAVIIPVIHQVVSVPLRTFRLVVARKGTNALLTSDKLRADITAEFFVRVQADAESITNAARSLGDRTTDEGGIKSLIEDKLVSALRTVAATKTLEDLNSKRDEFVQQVAEAVALDLKHNGFTLESATISELDQADTAALRDDNVFDAEGKLTIARITQDRMTQRNAIEQEKARERLAQDVDAQEKMYALEQKRAEAEALQQAAIAKANASQAEQAKKADIAALQSVEVAEERRQQAREEAARAKEAGIAKAEELQANAEEEKAKAQAQAERARQQIETAVVEETAQREKAQDVISAEAEAEQALVKAQRAADANAYTVEKDASARKAAADADAEAILKKATAEADAATKRADGERAVAMVPVDVNKQQVGVDSDAADVEIKLLANREKFGRAGIELEVKRMRIASDQAIGIKQAEAMGVALSQANMQLWGSPEMLSKMTEMFMAGQGVAHAANGFTSAASPEIQGLAGGLLAGGVDVIRGLALKLGVSEDKLSSVLLEAAQPPADEGGGGQPSVPKMPPPIPEVDAPAKGPGGSSDQSPEW